MGAAVAPLVYAGAGKVCVAHLDDAGLLGGAIGEAQVGHPLLVSVPVNKPVPELYVSERAT